MKSPLLLLSWVMLSVSLHGQQVSEIDLVAHDVPNQVAFAACWRQREMDRDSGTKNPEVGQFLSSPRSVQAERRNPITTG
jgi:hypothetical protein